MKYLDAVPSEKLFEQSYDFIVVGAGTAGCVVASNLSADRSLKVLLVEAGKNYADTPKSVLIEDPRWRCFFDPELYWPGYNWQYKDHLGKETYMRIIIARLFGGGGAVNGMQAQRGLPEDYNEWAQYGVKGWNWDEVLPYFKKLESDADYGGDKHSANGPVKIMRVAPEKWGKLALAVRDAWQKRGLPWFDDINGQGGDCVGPVPVSTNGQVRSSTSQAYLGADVMARDNLHVLDTQLVKRLLFKGLKAYGIELESGRTIEAPNVVVCSGAINTPALLLRSGIGPVAALQACQIPIVADRPGVGGNLRNHAVINLNAHIKPKGRQPATVTPPCVLLNRFSSNVAGCPPSDMCAMLWDRIPGAPLKRDPLSFHIASLTVQINKTYSTGNVTLDQRDISGAPRVEFDVIRDPRDFERIKKALLFSWQTFTDMGVSEYLNDVFFVGMVNGELKLQNNRSAAIISRLGSLVLDGPGALRKRILRSVGATVPDIRDDAALAEMVRPNATALGHWLGTCRMGSERDPQAVTDSRCRLIGVEGVWVIDASIFPTPMSGGTYLPTIMAAEKGSAMVLEDMIHSSSQHADHLETIP